MPTFTGMLFSVIFSLKWIFFNLFHIAFPVYLNSMVKYNVARGLWSGYKSSQAEELPQHQSTSSSTPQVTSTFRLNLPIISTFDRVPTNMSTTSTRSWYSSGQQMTGEGGNKFIIIERIAGGGYGAVYRVKAATDGRRYALKDEKREPNRNHYKLFMEVNVLKKAAEKPDEWQRCFPTLYDQRRGPENMFIVMTLLGESLADIKRRQRDRVFSANTALYCAIQSLEAIRCLHNMGYIHRDIKPANFVIGPSRSPIWNRIFMVDFGIARCFVNSNGSVLTPRQKTKFKGTVRFAPVATHKQQELGRKDDCESWIFMIVDMIRKERLPWHESDDRHAVEKMKVNAMKNPKTFFNDNQWELREICTYLSKQHYVDNLDYDWMRDMCRRVARRLNCDLNQPYDWHASTSTSRTQ